MITNFHRRPCSYCGAPIHGLGWEANMPSDKPLALHLDCVVLMIESLEAALDHVEAAE